MPVLHVLDTATCEHNSLDTPAECFSGDLDLIADALVCAFDDTPPMDNGGDPRGLMEEHWSFRPKSHTPHTFVAYGARGSWTHAATLVAWFEGANLHGLLATLPRARAQQLRIDLRRHNLSY